jgi:type II secretory pathway component PulF
VASESESVPQKIEQSGSAEASQPALQRTLAGFLTFVRDYKEFITLITAIIVGSISVLNYFATKNEMSIMHCQLTAHIQLVNAQIKRETLSKGIIDKKSLFFGPRIAVRNA